MNPAVILVGMIICGGIGFAIGNGKGRGGLGAVLGAFLGIIGIIIIAVMGPAYDAGQHDPTRGPPPTSGPGRAPAREPLETRLAKLDDLKTRGVLSDDEHARERQRVLADV